MDLLSNYKGWTLSDPRIATPQANMEICVFDAVKADPLSKKGKRECVLLAIANNNTQYECMIEKKAWDFLNNGNSESSKNKPN